MNPVTTVLLVGWLFSIIFVPTSLAGQTSLAGHTTEKATAWNTGSQLAQVIERPVSIAWTDAPLGPRLVAFSRGKRIAILIDRRLDPEQRINLKVENVTVEQFLFRLADTAGVGVCRLGDIWYLGPPETVRSLLINWRTLPRSTGNVIATLAWPELSTPQDLLSSIATSGCRVRNPDALPHDLWHAGSLPGLTPPQQLAAVSVGFGLWPESTRVRNEFQIVPFQIHDKGSASFQRSLSDETPTKSLRRLLAKKFRRSKFRVTKALVEAKGPADELYEVKRYLVDQIQPTIPADSEIRFTLNTAATRLRILKAIANQTKRELEFAPSLRSKLDDRVPIKCNQLTLDQLLSLLLEGSNVRAEVTAKKILLSIED